MAHFAFGAGQQQACRQDLWFGCGSKVMTSHRDNTCKGPSASARVPSVMEVPCFAEEPDLSLHAANATLTWATQSI